MTMEGTPLRTHDGVGHAAAGFAFGRRNLGEEVPVERAETFVDELGKDDRQRHNHQNSGDDCEHRDGVVR